MDDRSKPFLRALSGEPVWPPPFWLMRQAGRYLPEYRKVRAEVPDFVGLCTDPARATEVTLQPLRRYGMDAAILFSDILIVPWALKRDLRFAEGEGPLLTPLRSMAEVEALDVDGVTAAAAPVFETVSRLADVLPREHPGTALIGFSGGCWTVACYMVEGRGGGEFAAARKMAYGQPELFAALMERLEQATIRYLVAQAKAGAEALMATVAVGAVAAAAADADDVAGAGAAAIIVPAVAGARSRPRHSPVGSRVLQPLTATSASSRPSPRASDSQPVRASRPEQMSCFIGRSPCLQGPVRTGRCC